MQPQLSRGKPRPAARHTWQLLGSQYALTAWVGLLFGVPSLLSSVLLVQGEGIGHWWQYLFFSAVTWMVPLAVLAVFRFTVLPARNRKSRPILTLVAFMTAGASRGAVIYFASPLFGLQPWSDHVLRMVSEVITITAALSVIAVEVAARLNYRDALTSLARDREDLLELQMNAAQQFHAQREALVTEAHSILNPILESLRGSLRSAQDSTALALLSLRMRQVVDDTVRPLSTSIAQRSPLVERPGRLVPHSRGRLFGRGHTFELGQFILPLTVTVFMSVTSAAPMVVVVGWATGVQALEIMVITLYVLLWLVRLATLRLKVSPGWGTLLFCGLHGIVGLVYIAFVHAVDIDISDNLLVGWVLLLAGISFLLIRYQHIEWVRAEVISSQAAVNEELDLVLSSLRQQVRVESKRIATILHGPVQTALYAAAIRVTGHDEIPPEAAQAILSDLETAMAKLDNDAIDALPLSDFVSEIASVWGSSVSITFEQDEQAINILRKNPTALACVTEVVREGVNNAIKHAQATSVNISVFIAEPKLVDVVVKNPGRLDGDTATGFGAHVLNDLTHEWTLSDDNHNTTLWATVALDHVE